MAKSFLHGRRWAQVSGCFWLAGLGLGLVGCAGLGSTKEGAPVSTVEAPERWQGGGGVGTAGLDSKALAAWWKRFRDPALNALVKEALASSPDVRTALSKIEESRARRGVERAALFPWLSAGATGRTDRVDERNGGVSSSENYGASLDASWEVDLFGRQRQHVRAAEAEVAQARENFYGAQVSLAAEVAQAYVTWWQAQAQLAVAEDSVKTRGETTQITEWKAQTGVGKELDSLQARATLEQARAAIPRLKQTIAQSKNQLALLCGRAPGALDGLLVKSVPALSVPERLAVGIPAETLRQRPDVRAAERGVEATVALRKAAQRERLPSLNLSGSVGVEALKAGRLFSPEQVAASVLGNLSAPIFEAGRIGQNIRIQSEVERQAVIAYEKTVLTALSEVEDALVAVQRSRERLAVLRRAVTSAREAAVLAQQQYQAGQVDVLVVLEAQRTLLSVEDEMVTTQGDEMAAHIQLYKALGGGWGESGMKNQEF